MNPVEEINRLLDTDRAELVRQGNHYVYKLSNGRQFVRSKTPSDHRSVLNELSQLRRLLDTRREQPTMHLTDVALEPLHPPSSEPEESPVLVMEQEGEVKQRIQSAIKFWSEKYEYWLSRAQRAERRVQMLNQLLPFAEDPGIGKVLSSLSPAPLATVPEQAPAKEPIPEPPQTISDRVQVTRDLVYAATHVFKTAGRFDFTVSDVYEVMVGSRQVDNIERSRVRAAIAAAMITLVDQGKLVKTVQGRGRAMSRFNFPDHPSPNE